MALIPINSLEDLKDACKNHPYRNAEYLTDGTQYFEVSEDDNMNLGLIESYEGEEDALLYGINWEDTEMYTEEGVRIQAAYNF